MQAIDNRIGLPIDSVYSLNTLAPNGLNLFYDAGRAAHVAWTYFPLPSFHNVLLTLFK